MRLKGPFAASQRSPAMAAPQRHVSVSAPSTPYMVDIPPNPYGLYTPSPQRYDSHSQPPIPLSIRRQQSTLNTRYMQMLLDLDAVPKWANLLAATSTWILLAGFVVFPGTFTSIQQIEIDETTTLSAVESWILHQIRNLPLLVVAGACCGLGALGMCGLWLGWRKNYVWVCNRIFLPGTLHGLVGILTTLVNVYTAQDKQWSITARVSIIVESACFAICCVLYLFYSEGLLANVKARHREELGLPAEPTWESGLVEKLKRRGRELDPP